MLARSASRPFDDPRYLFEPKWDGLRAVAFRAGGSVWLQSRRGSRLEPAFPEIARGLAGLHGPARVIVDGEIIVPGSDGRPSFELALARLRRPGGPPSGQPPPRWPAVLMAFDLLYWDCRDLRPRPLRLRRRLLARWGATWPPEGPVRLSPGIVGRGTALFEEFRRLGLEGMVAKRLDSPYRPGRSEAWLKVKAFEERVFVIGGFIPDGASSLRSLLVARPQPGPPGGPGGLAGLVGSGLAAAQRLRLRERLEALALAGPAPQLAWVARLGRPELSRVRWVRPELFCRVRYLPGTSGGWLRHASFVGIVGR